MTEPALLSSYEYDANGLRTKKVEGGVETRFLLDGSSVLAEYDSANVATRRYLQNPESIDDILEFTEGGQVYFPLTDALGSVVAITDSTGAVVRRNSYDVYGARTSTGTGPDWAFGFTGREHDASGGRYHRDRYASASTGTWSQPDRLGTQVGPNLLVYGRASPTRFRDPDGFRVVTNDPEIKSALDYHIAMTPRGMILLNILTSQRITFLIISASLPVQLTASGQFGGVAGVTGALLGEGLDPWERVNTCGDPQITIRIDKVNSEAFRATRVGIESSIFALHAVVFHELMHAMQISYMTGASMFFAGSMPPNRIPLTYGLIGKQSLDPYLISATGGDTHMPVFFETLLYLDQHDAVLGQ